MGTNRFFVLWMLSGLAVSTCCLLNVQAQSSQSFDTSSAQQAYYPPQYQQYMQATYVPAQSGQYQAGSGQFPARLRTTSIQQRASDMLHTQQRQPLFDPSGTFGPSAPSIPRRGTNAGYRILKLNNSAAANQDSVDNNTIQDGQQFDPFADPPTRDQPKVDSPTDQIPQVPVAPPQDPDLQDPVLPGDAQFNPEPGQIPTLETPSVVEPKPEMPDEVVTPPDMNKPTQGDPPKTVVPPVADPMTNPPSDNRQLPPARPVPGMPVTPDGIYRAPPRDNMPPIVQPQNIVPYVPQTAPPLMEPFQMAPSFPGYQPPYQPEPAMPLPPGYAVPQSVVLEGPPTMVGRSIVEPTAVVPGNNVYSSVVSGDCSACQACDARCPNFYVSFLGGYAGLRDLQGKSNPVQIQADSGTVFGFAFGRRNGRNLRTEGEFSFRANDITGIQSGNMVQPLNGELNSFSGMANGYWEFIEVPTRCFKPYVGLGIGFISVETEIVDQIGQSLVAPIAEKDTSFAYQWMAGVNYKAYRNMDWFVEYRFLSADTFRIDTTLPGISGPYEFEADNVLLGFRWKF